jgi:hypothetical protein
MFSLFGFSIQEFFIAIFIVKKWPLYVNFNIPLVEIDDFLKVPHLV